MTLVVPTKALHSHYSFLCRLHYCHLNHHCHSHACLHFYKDKRNTVTLEKLLSTVQSFWEHFSWSMVDSLNACFTLKCGFWCHQWLSGRIDHVDRVGCLYMYTRCHSNRCTSATSVTVRDPWPVPLVGWHWWWAPSVEACHNTFVWY